MNISVLPCCLWSIHTSSLIENDSLLKAINPKTGKLWTQEQINAKRLKEHKEKNKKEQR